MKKITITQVVSNDVDTVFDEQHFFAPHSDQYIRHAILGVLAAMHWQNLQDEAQLTNRQCLN